MPEFGIRSPFTQCPMQLLMEDDAGLISTGTGFFYERNDNSYLITNWHNVSGKDSTTGAPLTAGRVPTHLKAKFITYIDERRFTAVAADVLLYNEDRSAPLWFEHPQLGSRCDVVALPLARPVEGPPQFHHFANRITRIRIPVRPGGPVFIVGFPHNLAVGFGIPLWKSGFIASEPHFDITWGGRVAYLAGMEGGITIPAFFLDALTRQGMSGSPVFASYTGNWDMTDPYRDVDPSAPDFHQRDDIALGENRMEFVGVYSGRVPSNEGEAALGLCWKVSAIDAICDHRVVGRHPHFV